MASEQDLVRALNALTAPAPQAAVSEAISRHAGLATAPTRIRRAAVTRADRVREAVSSDNVVGLGIAEKVSDNHLTGQLALTVYVIKKRLPDELSGAEMVPPALPDALSGGKLLPTDVVEIGRPVPEVNITREVVEPGYSIGHVKISAGTLGAFVTKSGQQFILSNSHVLANSGLGRPGDAIVYPGKHDGGKTPADKVGSLTDFVAFDASGEYVNLVDCALASIDPARAAQLKAEILGLGLPRGIIAPRRGMTIVKVGRTTGKTEGTIKDVHFRVKINYDGVGTVGFTQQVLCTRYSDGGDSGALVFDKATMKAVGLHFGGSPGGEQPASFFNPIRAVLKALGVALVTRTSATATKRPATAPAKKSGRRKSATTKAGAKRGRRTTHG